MRRKIGHGAGKKRTPPKEESAGSSNRWLGPVTRAGSAASNKQWLPRLLVLALPALIVFVPNLRTLGFGLVYDDPRVVTGAGEQVRNDLTGLLVLTRRPMRTLSFALDEWLFGGQAWGYHLSSVIWASANALLVMLLAHTISGSRRASLAAGALFAAHPVHVEAIANIANRKDLLAFAFGVAAVVVFSPPLLRNRFPSVARSVIGGALICLCVLSKEVVALGILGVLLVMALPSLRILVKREQPSLRRISSCLVIPLTSLVIGCVLARRYLPPMRELYAPDRLRHLSSGLVEAPLDWVIRSGAGVARSASLLIFPIQLSADYPVPPGGPLGIVSAVLGALFLLGTLSVGLKMMERYPLMGVGLVWFLPTMLPVMNVMPLSSFFVADRYLYLPSLGAVFIEAALLDLVPGVSRFGRARVAPRRWLVTVICIVVLAAARSMVRMEIWRDSRSLWAATCRDSPASWRARIVMGGMLADEGSYDDAIRKFREASQIIKMAARPHVLIGEVMMKRGDYGLALEQFLEAARLEPQSVAAKRSLGAAYQAIGAESAASGDWAALYNALGAQAAVGGEWAAAESLFQKGLAFSPTDADSLCNLAKVRILLEKFAEAADPLDRGRALVGDGDWCKGLPDHVSTAPRNMEARIGALNRAVERAPQIIHFRLYLIQAYLLDQRPCDADRHCLDFPSPDRTSVVPSSLRAACEEAARECSRINDQTANRTPPASPSRRPTSANWTPNR